MANSEDIGGISIGIGADFSEVDAQFQAAIAKFIAEGKTLAEAIQAAVAAPDVSGLADALGQGGAAAQTLADKMDAVRTAAESYAGSVASVRAAQADADEELKIAQSTLEQIQSSYSAGQASANELARAAQNVQSAFASANPAIQESGQAATAASSAFSVMEGVLGALGVQLTLAAFVNFAEDVAASSDSITRANISLTALTGSATQAADVIERLGQLGMQDGLSMPSLRQAAQSMEMMLPAGTDVVGILSQLADGAAVSGKSIDAAASAFDRIAEGGQASVRQFQAMGISIDLLKTTMNDLGISADGTGRQIMAAFNLQDANDKMVILQDAMLKFQGIAKDVADNTFSGAFHQAMAQWDTDIGIVQKDLGTLASGALGSALKDAVNLAAAAFVSAGTLIVASIDAVEGAIQGALTIFKAYGEAVGLALTGNWAGAAAVAATAFSQIADIEQQTQAKVNADMAAGQKIIQDIMTQTASSITPVIGNLDHLGGSTKDAAAAAKELASEWKAANDIIQQSNDIAAKIPGNIKDYFESLAEGGKTAKQLLAEVTTELQKAYDKTTSLKGEPLAAVLDIIGALEKMKAPLLAFADAGEWQKIGEQFQRIEDTSKGLQGNTIAIFSGILTELSKIPGAVATNGDALLKWFTEAARLDDQLAKQQETTQKTFDKAYDKYLETTQDRVIPVTATLEQRLKDLDARFQEINGVTFTGLAAAIDGLKLTVNGISDKEVEVVNALQTVVTSSTTGLAIVEEAWRKAGKAVDDLARVNLPAAEAVWGEVLAKLISLNAPLGEIIAVQERMLQAWITAGEQSGQAVGGLIVQLQNLKLAQEQLKTSADGWGPAYVATIKNMQGAFDSVNKSIGDVIVSGKNLEDVFANIWKTLGAQEINILVTGALKPLEAQFLNIGNAAAKLGPVVGESAAQAAEGMKAETAAINATVAGAKDLSTGMKDVSDTTSAASSSWGKFASSLGTAIPLMAAAYEAGKLLGGALRDLFSGPSSLNITSNLPIAGLSGTNVSELARSLGIDLSAGGALGLGTQGSPGFSPGTAPGTDTIAAAIGMLNTQIDRLMQLQTGLNNEMIQAYAAGNTYLGDKLAADLQTVSGAIKSEQATLATITPAINAGTAVLTNGMATTAQMAAALQTATDQLNSSKLQQGTLLQELLVAQSTGNTALVTSINGQLGTLNGTITSQTATLGTIRSAIDASAPAIIAGFDLLQKALAGSITDPISAAIVALEAALHSGDIQSIQDMTAALQTALGPTNAGIAAIPSGFQASADDIKGAIQKEQDAITQLNAEKSDLTNALAEAILAGDDKLVSALNTQLGTVNSNLGTANTNLNTLQTLQQPGTGALVTATSGVKASVDQMSEALSKAQGNVQILKDAIADLNQQLIIAVANGDTALITKLEALIGTTNSDLNTATGILGQISANTAGSAAALSGQSGVVATPEQTATAITNLQATIKDLQSQAADLNQQLTVAIANGDMDLAGRITNAINTLNGTVSTDQNYLKGLQPAVVNAITSTGALTAEQITTAINNAKTDVDSLKTHLADLNRQLVLAEAANNKDLVTAIQGEITATTSQLGTANNLLTQLVAITTPAPAAKAVDLSDLFRWITDQMARDAAQITAALGTNNQAAADQAKSINDTLTSALHVLQNPPAKPTAEYIALVNQIEQDTLSLINAQQSGNFTLATTIANKINDEIIALGPLAAIQANTAQTATNTGGIADLANAVRGLNNTNTQSNPNAPTVDTSGTRAGGVSTGVGTKTARDVQVQEGPIARAPAPPDTANRPFLDPNGGTPLPPGQYTNSTGYGQTAVGNLGALYGGGAAAAASGTTPSTAPPPPDIAAGFKATADQISAAIQDEKNILAGLQGKQADLLQALAAAVASGDTALQTGIQAELSSVSSGISGAQSTLTQLNGLMAPGVGPVINGLSGIKATADQLATAQKAAQSSVDSLTAQSKDLTQQLIVAEAAGNSALVTTIQAQIGTTNTDLSKATGLLTQINSSVAIVAAAGISGNSGLKASADDIATAAGNLNGYIKGLTAQAADLNQQLILAIAAGDMVLAGQITAALSAVNSQLTTDTTLLGQIAPPVVAAITGTGALTAAQISQAITNETNTIHALMAKLSDLNTQLIQAIASGNTALIATIQQEIGTTNSELSTANGLLASAKSATPTPATTPTGPTYGGPATGGAVVPQYVPGYADGGIMPYTGMAYLHAGEIVLPPDLSSMLRRMASTPSVSASFPSPMAGALSMGGGISNQTINFQISGVNDPETMGRIIMDKLRTASGSFRS